MKQQLYCFLSGRAGQSYAFVYHAHCGLSSPSLHWYDAGSEPPNVPTFPAPSFSFSCHACVYLCDDYEYLILLYNIYIIKVARSKKVRTDMSFNIFALVSAQACELYLALTHFTSIFSSQVPVLWSSNSSTTCKDSGLTGIF